MPPDPSSPLPGPSAAGSETTGAAGWLAFCAFAAVCLASLVVRARAKPFWHDEIFTILHAGLPGLDTMWRAGLDGFDLAPPLNAWATKAVHAVAGVGHVSTRVPPIAGFMAMTAVTFQVLRTRANTVTALSGVLLACFTAGYRYAYEARGYGLRMGLAALALYAWSEAARGRRLAIHRPLLALALAAGVWAHYYALLVFLPVAVGEAVRTWRQRRPDLGMAAAVGVAALAVAPLYPLTAAARAQSAGFWSPASISDVGAAYAYLFAPVLERQFAWAALVVIGVAVATRRVGPERNSAPRRLPAHEVAAAITVLLLPLAGVLLAVAVTGAFVPRYAMPAVFAFSLIFPLAVRSLRSRGHSADVLLCGFLAVTFVRGIGPSLVAPLPLRDPFLSRPVLQDALGATPELVSASSLQYLQYWYYAPTELQPRLRYLADAKHARRLMGADTIDRGYLTLARWTDVPVAAYDAFIAEHHDFQVYEAGSGWLLQQLEAAGATLTAIAAAPGERLFLVSLAGDVPP